MCQQSTPNWKIVGSMLLLDKSSFCDGNSTGNQRNRWSERENTGVVIAVEGAAPSDKVA